MPLYDYQCAACGRRFEIVHGVHADGPTVCPLCGKGPVRKAITAPAVHYKGSGWAKKERRATSTSGSSKASGEGSAKGEGGAKSNATAEGGSPEAGTPAPSKAAEAGAASTTD
jgi:putative FmdB family regulatory protein